MNTKQITAANADEKIKQLYEKAAHLAQVLYALAELSAGVEVEDPAAFTDAVTELF